MTSCGFFGKLPALGDFVSRRVQDGLRETWDEWLQAGLVRAKADTGDEWEALYLSGPVWRFALPPGYAAPEACCGLWLPSVDRVGRKFPMTVLATVESAPKTLELMAEAADFLAAAETLVVAALQGEVFDLGIFENDIANLHDLLPMADEPGRPVSADAIAWMLALPFGTALEVEIPELLGDRAYDELDGLGLWWTAGSAAVAPALLVSSEMPPDNGFVPLLNGRFDDNDYWQEVALAAETDDANGQPPPDEAPTENTA